MVMDKTTKKSEIKRRKELLGTTAFANPPPIPIPWNKLIGAVDILTDYIEGSARKKQLLQREITALLNAKLTKNNRITDNET
ncbi:MAG TPA: hypothetical protein ENK96_04825 [Desulfobulbaceae bacterium]|nr:hypothetical protein [Desulfobulbaceae bacterium]